MFYCPACFSFLLFVVVWFHIVMVLFLLVGVQLLFSISLSLFASLSSF